MVNFVPLVPSFVSLVVSVYKQNFYGSATARVPQALPADILTAVYSIATQAKNKTAANMDLYFLLISLFRAHANISLYIFINILSTTYFTSI
jgi:hypothetical protein